MSTAAPQLWLGEAPTWREVKRCHPVSRELADRHYSRQTPGARDFMGSGWTLVLSHESDAGIAAWGVILNRAPGTTEWRWRCSIFRNESSLLSSELIHSATELTLDNWPRKYGALPSVPLQTEVDAAKVKRKRDPGRCFAKAGWLRSGYTNGGLVLLEAPRFTIRMMGDALRRYAWTDETAHPDWVAKWSRETPEAGQCAVTALVMQDAFGGHIIRGVVDGHGSHYWNRLPLIGLTDLTWDQFPTGTQRPEGVEVSRLRLLSDIGTAVRYVHLVHNLRRLWDPTRAERFPTRFALPSADGNDE